MYVSKGIKKFSLCLGIRPDMLIRLDISEAAETELCFYLVVKLIKYLLNLTVLQINNSFWFSQMAKQVKF